GRLPLRAVVAPRLIAVVVAVVVVVAPVVAVVPVLIVPVAVRRFVCDERIGRGTAEVNGEPFIRRGRRVNHLDRDCLGHLAGGKGQRPEGGDIVHAGDRRAVLRDEVAWTSLVVSG